MKRTLLYMVKLGKNEPHETPPVRLDSNSRVSIHHCQWVRQLITSVLMHSALHYTSYLVWGEPNHLLQVKHTPLCITSPIDRKSTRLNSSHQIISYAVFCLKKKNRL